MKKFRVSKYYNGIFSVSFLFPIIWEVLLIWATDDGFRTWTLYYILHAIAIITFLIGIYIMLTDLPTARFSFSDEGITMYVGFRKYETQWSEFAYAGIVAVNVEAIKSIYTSDLFWVYFSKSFLTDREKLRFLPKTRKDQTRIAYFQYSKPVFDLVLEQVPEELRQQLLWDEEHIIGQMNFWEKVYNK